MINNNNKEEEEEKEEEIKTFFLIKEVSELSENSFPKPVQQ